MTSDTKKVGLTENIFHAYPCTIQAFEWELLFSRQGLNPPVPKKPMKFSKPYRDST